MTFTANGSLEAHLPEGSMAGSSIDHALGGLSARTMFESLPLPAILIDEADTLAALNPAMTRAMAEDDSPAASAAVTPNTVELLFRGQQSATLRGRKKTLKLRVSPMGHGLKLGIINARGSIPNTIPKHRADPLTGLPDRSVLEPLFAALRASAD